MVIELCWRRKKNHIGSGLGLTFVLFQKKNEMHGCMHASLCIQGLEFDKTNFYGILWTTHWKILEFSLVETP